MSINGYPIDLALLLLYAAALAGLLYFLIPKGLWQVQEQGALISILISLALVLLYAIALAGLLHLLVPEGGVNNGVDLFAPPAP